MKSSTWIALFTALALVSHASAAELATSQLPRTDLVRTVTESIGGRLRDEVISSGVLNLSAWTVSGDGITSDARLAAFNERLAAQLAKRYSGQSLPASFEFKTTVQPFSEKALDATARILADEVNAYDPASGDVRRLARNLWVIANRLGVKRDEPVVVVSSRGVYNDEDSDKRHFTQTIFLNQKTRKAVVAYMVEGRM